MPRAALEVADIFRQHGPAYRAAQSLPLAQLRVMRAVEVCRTAVLGGHIEKCGHCDHTRQAYNSCRNRHCPKCQTLARARWLESRTARSCCRSNTFTSFSRSPESDQSRNRFL